MWSLQSCRSGSSPQLAGVSERILREVGIARQAYTLEWLNRGDLPLHFISTMGSTLTVGLRADCVSTR